MIKTIVFALSLAVLISTSSAADNVLSEAEGKEGWTLLFNGKDFSGWTIDKWNPDSFSIEDGAIKCHGKPSMIYHTAEGGSVKDFHFSAHVMTKPGANGGIFFHTQYQDKGWPVGHEAQINMTQRDPVKTGSVYIVKKHLEAPAKDNEWFLYEIIVKGKRVETKVNGKTVVVYEEGADVKGKRKLSEGSSAFRPTTPEASYWSKTSS